MPRKSTKSPTEYVNARAFREEIILSKSQDELTPRAIEMLMIMCNESAKRKSYKSEQDKEDCISTALLDCCLYWRGYDPTKSDNCFAYYSSLIFNGMQKGWKKLHKLKHSNKVSLSHQNLYNI